MTRRRLLAVCSLCLAALGWMITSPVSAQTQNAQHKIIRVAAAADLRPVLPVLAQEYEQQTGVRVEASFASSSTLATQIINGAPFDLFLAADFTFPEKVVAANLATEKAPVPYAHGVLVLWARKNSPIHPLTVDNLTDSRIQRIAIADGNRAPYGRAAYALLRSMHLLDQLQPKLVIGENIGQTAQFVQSGNAQVGLISLTLASSAPMRAAGEFARVPNAYPEIRQCAVVVRNSANQQEAQRFLTWMLSDKVQESLKSFGLDPVR